MLTVASPEEIRQDYTKVTAIPILPSHPTGEFGVLLDPHTGIPLPTEHIERATAAYAPISFIVSLADHLRPKYIVCFDQSYHRAHRLSRAEQRKAKRRALQQRGILSFHYVSHAPFLFAAAKAQTLAEMRSCLRGIGIPENRLE
jgi:hypothetical protein